MKIREMKNTSISAGVTVPGLKSEVVKRGDLTSQLNEMTKVQKRWDKSHPHTWEMRGK